MSELKPCKRMCPDGGACHHNCFDNENCWRVNNCLPLSIYGESWNTRAPAPDKRELAAGLAGIAVVHPHYSELMNQAIAALQPQDSNRVSVSRVEDMDGRDRPECCTGNYDNCGTDLCEKRQALSQSDKVE